MRKYLGFQKSPKTISFRINYESILFQILLQIIGPHENMLLHFIVELEL